MCVPFARWTSYLLARGHVSVFLVCKPVFSFLGESNSLSRRARAIKRAGGCEAKISENLASATYTNDSTYAPNGISRATQRSSDHTTCLRTLWQQSHKACASPCPARPGRPAPPRLCASACCIGDCLSKTDRQGSRSCCWLRACRRICVYICVECKGAASVLMSVLCMFSVCLFVWPCPPLLRCLVQHPRGLSGTAAPPLFARGLQELVLTSCPTA
ncbi:hypothetical protein HDK90DRAFT_30471 [Phyllosticta capitalensis]|uniref:Uncharacterized protein n=1 Tax=Phyllosticta capitalensis TaxID=121624 RepID=A0ABR1Z3W5_9PEZI